MDPDQLAVISHYSALMPALALLVFRRRITSSWVPFIWFIIVGIINEFVSQFWISNFHSNLVNSNLYVAIEFILLVWQFYRWRPGARKVFFIVIICAGLAVWLLDNIILHRLYDNNSLYRIFYSIVLVLFSIDQLNRELIYEKKQLLRNARFLICFTFMVYYGNKAFIESFNIYHLDISPSFYGRLFVIMDIINIAASIIFSLAILCLRPRTILQ